MGVRRGGLEVGAIAGARLVAVVAVEGVVREVGWVEERRWKGRGQVRDQ